MEDALVGTTGTGKGTTRLRVLTVGDGDFSFSLALARCYGPNINVCMYVFYVARRMSVDANIDLKGNIWNGMFYFTSSILIRIL